MSKKSRTQYSIINVSASALQRLVQTLLSFAVRTVFVARIGGVYLGVNGLMTNVLSILSIGELGFGTAIISALYEPVANNRKEQIKSLMRLYGRVYKVICAIIAVTGMCMMPFLDVLVKGEAIPHLQLIFTLYLINSASSYLFAYKRSILNANQQNYYITISKLILDIIKCCTQMVIILTLGNYLLYLATEIVCTVSQNIYITLKADKLYPFLKEKDVQPLQAEVKEKIKRNVGGTILYKMSGTILNGTDNILISTMIGVLWVGIYSNFTLVIKAIQSFLDHAISSIGGSVGNLTAKTSKEKHQMVYLRIFFLSAWIYGICTVGFWHLLNPFVEMWLGKDYCMSEFTVALVVTNFYIVGIQAPTTMFRTAYGLMWEGRFRPLATVVLNLGSSIVFAKWIGLPGVFLGTLFSNIAVLFWYDPMIIYKYGFCCSSKPYFAMYGKFAAFTAISVAVIYPIKWYIKANTVAGFLIVGIICVLSTLGIYAAAFRNSKEMKYYIAVIKRKIK